MLLSNVSIHGEFVTAYGTIRAELRIPANDRGYFYIGTDKESTYIHGRMIYFQKRNSKTYYYYNADNGDLFYSDDNRYYMSSVERNRAAIYDMLLLFGIEPIRTDSNIVKG